MFFRKLSVALLFFVLTVSTASAYTIIMRDGRRVEIPNEFTVTNSTLTYKVGSGIQITIQLNTVDIVATERANGQPKGSLLLRSSAPKTAAGPAQKRQEPARSITNAHLEVFRQTRIQSELAYEERRKELGMPSVEERQREAAAIQERTREQLLSMRSQEQSSEEYWRDRATTLRTEMAANQAQIDFVRRRLDEIPSIYLFGQFATTIPFGTVATPIASFPFQNLLTPNIFAPSLVTGTRFGANAGINTMRRGSGVFVNPGRFQRGPGNGRSTPFFPGGNVLALPFQSIDYSLERTELISHMNQLLMQRAGLKARWREMEEEARKAGAYPGWLRP